MVFIINVENLGLGYNIQNEYSYNLKFLCNSLFSTKNKILKSKKGSIFQYLSKTLFFYEDYCRNNLCNFFLACSIELILNIKFVYVYGWF